MNTDAGDSMDPDENTIQATVRWLHRAAKELTPWTDERVNEWLAKEEDHLRMSASLWWHETPAFWVACRLMPCCVDDVKDMQAWHRLLEDIQRIMEHDEEGAEISWEAYEDPDQYPWEQTRKRIAAAIEKADLRKE